MKKMFLIVLAAVFSGICGTVSAAPANSEAAGNETGDILDEARSIRNRLRVVWYTRMDEAQKAARKEKKVIFANFTGSDWCPWCVRLHDEVLNQPAFKEYAAKNLVLLLVDFPQNKVQTENQKEANNALARKYGIRGFPTILILDSDGKVLAKTGYRRGGASAYVNHLKSILK